MRDFKFFREKAKPKLSDYNELGLTCIGVSLLYFSPETFNPVRYLMFKDTMLGTIIKGQQIESGHPLFEWELTPNPVVE